MNTTAKIASTITATILLCAGHAQAQDPYQTAAQIQAEYRQYYLMKSLFPQPVIYGTSLAPSAYGRSGYGGYAAYWTPTVYAPNQQSWMVNRDARRYRRMMDRARNGR